MSNTGGKDSKRTYGIGIDSGGTFTDGVIIDLSCGKIIKAIKTRTTHHKLLIGVRNCLDALDAPKDKIAVVSLSTTLATNSVVEGKGADVATLLVGQKTMEKIPAEAVFDIDGGHDSAGNPLMDLDMETAKACIEEVKDKVSAFAVSSIMSVRNPEHELQLKRYITETYGMPVICGHELTSALGAYERAVTATLNARLLPVIRELISSVHQSLEEKGIDAPLMLVRGDGSLVAAEQALDRPIETMLSGPAASIIGARYLTGLDNAIVTDMGGTTTDTALIRDGLPRVSENGALVGGFLTRVKAVDIHTIGLGGDSHVQVGFDDNEITVGPQRVVPLCVIAEEHEHIVDELSSLINMNLKKSRHQPADFLMLTNKGLEDRSVLPSEVRKELEKGPHTVEYLGNKLGMNTSFMSAEAWKDKGLVMLCGLTPTDFKVFHGDLEMGVPEAPRLGVELTCQNYGIEQDVLYTEAIRQVNKMISGILYEEVMGDRKGFAESREFLQNETFDDPRPAYNLDVSLNIPIIAVGAPVQAYYPEVMDRLKSELVIPENSHVANAVGAVTGQIIERVELLIRPQAKGWVLYTPWEKFEYPCDNLEQGLEVVKVDALKMAEEHALEQAKKNGGHDIKVKSHIEDVRIASVLTADERYYLEGHVHAIAMGDAYKIYLDE
ncbi:MAG: hydantoinase/oxoprolinase family protein [Eggerthellaceae bacterium]|nr:hydantoinase/oxoprolinase family protein [Eggerthellaceae bacterium]